MGGIKSRAMRGGARGGFGKKKHGGLMGRGSFEKRKAGGHAKSFEKKALAGGRAKLKGTANFMNW